MRAGDELVPIGLSDVSVTEKQGAVETMTLDGKPGGFDFYYMQAKVPLRWRAK